MAGEQLNKESGMHPVNTDFDPVSLALQELYNVVANEELQDDFLKILDEIDAKFAAAKLSSSQ